MIASTASELSEVIRAVAALLWAVGGGAVVLLAWKAVKDGSLTELNVGPSGVGFKRAEQKLQESVEEAERAGGRSVPASAQHAIIKRLDRHRDLLRSARVLWVDDHPEYNASVVQLLEEFGTKVELARTNDEAIKRLEYVTYDAIITDVRRDDEGERSDVKGIDFAEKAYRYAPHGVILYTLNFDPANHRHRSDGNDASADERLELVRQVQSYVFGTATSVDGLLHLVVDLLSRPSQHPPNGSFRENSFPRRR
jgi:CheY-like chemotaxis protein